MLGFKQQAGAENNELNAANAQTVIGAETVIEGNVKLEESIIIRGKVYGDLTGSETVTIDTQGAIMGNISCQHLTIAGRVLGNVTVTGTLRLMTKAHLKGDADTHSLVVDEVAIFNGTCTMSVGGQNHTLTDRKRSGQ